MLELSQNLDQAVGRLLAREYSEALDLLQLADLGVIRFQRKMRKIANTVGLDIDPVRGIISPR